MKKNIKQVRTCRRGGFTLIELLVVISLITVLLAMLLPAVGSAREAARRAVCASNLRSLTLTMVMYDQDHREFPNGTFNRRNAVNQYDHITLRDNYGVPQKMVECPSQNYELPSVWQWSKNNQFGHMDYWYFAGYGNRTVGNPPQTIQGWLGWSHIDEGYFPKLSMVSSPAYPSVILQPYKQFILLDIGWYDFFPTYSYWPTLGNHVGTDANTVGENVAYLDGHVQWHALTPGVSWELHNEIWWTPAGSAPAGAIFLP